MSTKLIIAGVLAGVVYFILGWLVYGMFLEGIMADMVGSAQGVAKSQDEMMGSMHFLIIGQLFYGFLLAYVFSKWANISTVIGGAKGGALLGLLSSAAIDFTLLGTTQIATLSGALLDIVAFTIISAVAGAVAGWWLGRD